MISQQIAVIKERTLRYFELLFTLIHMVDGWMGRVSMCNETLLDECYLCLLAQVSFILEFAKLWQLHIHHPANEDFRNASLPDSTQLADSSLFRRAQMMSLQISTHFLTIFFILDST